MSIRALAASAVAAVAVAACGGTHAGKATQPVHGLILGGTQAGVTVAQAMGGVPGLCAGAVPGGQVVIKGPDGTLLATATLKGHLTDEIGEMYFDTRIPAGHGPYTVDVVGVSSAVFQNLKDLHLTC